MSPVKQLRIMIVDDEEIVHQTIGDYLRDLGHAVDSAWEGFTALKKLEAGDYDLILVDIRMPEMDGITLLEKIQELSPEISVVIITGHGSMNIAIKALRLGAADFLIKPIKLLELDAVLEKSVRIRSLRQGQRRLRETISGIQSSDDFRWRNRRLIGVSPATLKVKEQIQAAVTANCETILLTGETGTGKEVVAREIHFLGKGDEKPFIAVSSPAIPDSLFESELFGHVKGSFTGADREKSGYFELANGGTLFLDEISDLSASAQAKLLRALETRSFRRVGGSKEIEVNVQVIAATNTSLISLVGSGKFRRDLFYRLNVFSINLLPLRERREDIKALAEDFLSTFATRSGFRIEGFSPEAETLLLNYDYPGNCRELRNLIECAAILCRSGRIQPRHFNLAELSREIPRENNHTEDKGERNRIVGALTEAKWNRRLAAKILGIPYSTLRFKIQKHGIK